MILARSSSVNKRGHIIVFLPLELCPVALEAPNACLGRVHHHLLPLLEACDLARGYHLVHIELCLLANIVHIHILPQFPRLL